MPEHSLKRRIAVPEGHDDPAELDGLTPRERDVLDQVIEGRSSKEAGRRLGISPRTIEVHRARVMEKLGAKNTADLVRIAFAQGYASAEPRGKGQAR